MDGASLEALCIEQALCSLKNAAHLPLVDSLVTIVHKCRAFRSLAFACSLRAQVHATGLDLHPSLGNFLVPMLVECGGFSQALQAFHRLHHRREHSWTSLIQGSVDCGNSPFALSLFKKMREDLVYPSPFTLQALLRACSQLKYLDKGLEVHTLISMTGFDADPFVGNTLIDMYAKCGSFMEAGKMFSTMPARDVVSWNALMSGCAEYMLFEEAMWFWENMKLSGSCPSIVTFLCMLKACGRLQALTKGQEAHAEIVAQGFETDSFIGNALVDMYAKCEAPIESLEVFYSLQNRGTDAWNTLITAYLELGLDEEALDCLEKMEIEDVCSNDITLLCSLKVCGDIGLLHKGRSLHIDVAKQGFDQNSFLGNTLVDMYAKCGSLDEALNAFLGLLVRDIVSWNALVAGYAREGEGDILLSCIQAMMHEGVQPNWVTFLHLLTECNHRGLVQYGQEIYLLMISCGFDPNAKHFSCLMDLFGCSGQVDEGMMVTAMLSPHLNPALWQVCHALYQSSDDFQTGMFMSSWSTANKDLFYKLEDEYTQGSSASIDTMG